MRQEYSGFRAGNWEREIDVRDFIQLNYTPYSGDASFLEAPTAGTKELWEAILKLFKLENEKVVLDAETKVPSTITAYGPGYINRDIEQIVGLQTDKPLKRAICRSAGLGS